MPINPDSNRRQCHEKSCHCVTEYWLFGRYHRNNKITDETELKFGVSFRRQNAEFVQFGTLPNYIAPYYGDNRWFVYNKQLGMTDAIRETACDMFDDIDMYLDV